MSDSSDSGWSDDEGDEAAPSEAVESVATSAAQPQYQAQAFFFNKASQTYEPRGPCAVQARNLTAARCNLIVLCDRCTIRYCLASGINRSGVCNKA